MELTVYSAPWCTDCRVAKRWLAKHKIAYTEINIEEIPGAAAEVIQHVGKRAIPQFVLDGQWIQPYRPGEGFLYDDMAKLFGISE
jgi:glutaredoxin